MLSCWVLITCEGRHIGCVDCLRRHHAIIEKTEAVRPWIGWAWRMEKLVVLQIWSSRLVWISAWSRHRDSNLLECCFVHIFKQLVLLSQLILKNEQFCVYLTIFVPQVVNLHLGQHILLVEVLSWLKSDCRDLALVDLRALYRRVEYWRSLILCCGPSSWQCLRHTQLIRHFHRLGVR